MKYAGTYAGGDSGNTNGQVSTSSITATMLLSLQTDLVGLVSPEVLEMADSAPLDGSGLFEEDCSGVDHTAGGVILTGHGVGGLSGRRRPAAAARGRHAGADSLERWKGDTTTKGPAMGGVAEVEYVGGLSRALGECDAVVVLYDGSRLPVHSCLLAAFSGTFRELFLVSGSRRVRHRRRHHHRGCRSNDRCVCSCCGDRRTKEEREQQAAVVAVETSPVFMEATEGVAVPAAAREEDRRMRARDVHAVLTGYSSTTRETGQRHSTTSGGTTVEGQVSAAAWAAVSAAAEHGGRRRQFPTVLEWGPARGEIFVKFWGAVTMAAVVKHVYSGRPPSEITNPEGLVRLLAAAASLRMPRLMRQVEHLLSATLFPQQKGAVRPPHVRVGRLLRAARAVGAKDLESRCTLYLQTNGRLPAIMKVRLSFLVLVVAEWGM